MMRPSGDQQGAGASGSGIPPDGPDPDAVCSSGGTDRLFDAVYEQLRGLAHRQMTHERPGRSLQTTALVHEAYLRLSQSGDVTWNSPGHFFGAAAEAMRRILIERARKRLTLKRGGDRVRVSLDESVADEIGADTEAAAVGMLALDEALEALERTDARLAEVVKLRYFAGLSVEETASALGRSPRSVKRDWSFARAWLARRIQGGDDGAEESR